MKYIYTLLSKIERKISSIFAEPKVEIIKLFGLFGIVNYSAFYLIGYIFFLERNAEAPRGGAMLMSLFLACYEYWPASIKQYKKIIWYSTILYCIPFFGAYMFFLNNESNEWRTNILMGAIWLGLITDWVSMLILTCIGWCVGFAACFYYHKIGTIHLSGMSGFLLNYLWVVMLAAVFNRKRELVEQEQKLAELNEVNQKLSKVLSAKTEFLRNMSHEVRTPVHGFTNLSEGLVENYDKFSDNDRKKYLKDIAKNAHRLWNLVSNLLDASKFEAGKIVLKKEKFDFLECLSDMIEECHALYLKNGKNIVINLAVNRRDNYLVYADRERVIQLLRNLLTNAIKFSPQDSGVLDIELKALDHKDVRSLMFCIKDRGPGVPIEELQAIFHPFFISSNTKTMAGGTGLGLSICADIIEAHRGEIWAENNDECEGATFTFVIPVGILPVQILPGQNSQQTHGKGSKKSKKPVKNKAITAKLGNSKQAKTILMIDDEEVCLNTMEIMLSSTDITLVKALSGADGLRILEWSKFHPEGKIDIILLDLMMPDIYGIDLLEKIKQDPAFANIPVIIQTGISGEEELERAFLNGASGFLKKPYKKDEVFDLLSV